MRNSAEGRTTVRWLIKGLGPGGAETLLVSAARLIDQERFDLEVDYLLPWKQHLVGDLEDAGVRTRCLDVRHPADPRWLTRFLAGIGDVDIVHVHSPLLAGLVRPAIRALPRRPGLLATEHNVWRSFPPLSRIANRVTNRLDDATIAVSDEVRRSMSDAAGARAEVLVHGVDLSAIQQSSARRDEVRAELGVPGDRRIAITVANLRANKAYPDLLEAARLTVERDDHIDFLAVGQGPLENELRALHASLGLGDRFRFLGYQPAAYRLLAAADVFVMASHHEGYPVAVMEAMAAGLPVVATEVGGMAEAIRDGVDGRLVRPSAPAELSEAVLDVLHDEARRAAMGVSARERSKRYDMGRAAVRIEEIYDEVMAGRRGAR